MPENDFVKLKPHPFRSPGSSGPEPRARGAGGAPAYAELCVTSNYTFLTGASHPEEFVAEAAALGYRAVALTDTNTVAGVVRAHVAAKDRGVQFVLGSRLRLTDAGGVSIFVYPTDMAAYRRMCRLLTIGKRRAPKGECRLTLEDLGPLAEGLLAIAACDGAIDTAFETVLGTLRGIFQDRLSLAASVRYGGDDAERLALLADLGARARVPLAATNDAHCHRAERRMLQDVLTCIRHGCTLAQAGLRLHANAERHLKPPDEMHRLFVEHPGAIRRALEIAERASGFTLDQLRYEYPEEVVPAGCTAQQHLTDLAWKGAAERYPGGVPAKVRGHLEHELRLIEELNYAPYFLTVHDLVRYARSGEELPGVPAPNGWAPILCQGRGAAANSAVCYCLGVTAVDPSCIDLLFERFVSKERNEPPDIDIDFEHERREEVIQYIYRKYGRDRAGLTAEVITYRRRSAVRDVGKALGLSLDLVDRLAKDIEWWDKGSIEPNRLREHGLNPNDPTLRWLARLMDEILGFPRHLSQHVGGFVITRTPLCELVPVENAAMPDRTVIEWDKDDIDAVGMLKVDVLGLGMLTALRWCLDFVNGGRGRDKGTEGQRDKVGKAAGKGAKEPGPSPTHSVPLCLCPSVPSSFRMDKVGEGGRRLSNIVEESHERDTDFQGSACLAAREGVGEGDLSSHCSDARERAPGTHESDAPSGRLRSVEHCGGVRASDEPGVSALSSRGERIPCRAMHAIRTGGRDEDDPDGPGNTGASSRAGSNAAVAHNEDSIEGTGREKAIKACRPVVEEEAHPRLVPPHSVPLSLRPSVPSPLHLHTIPPDDPSTYAMIQRADTIGVFQIESRAQMSMLPRLRPAEFYDLVIEVAIVRPGPIQGDMVHPYLRRRAGEEPVEYVHPAIREVLRKTLGVPLFQEQCMALAVKAAGFTPGEADQLRRAMAAWKRKGDQIHRFGQKLIDGMEKKGIPRDFAVRCFEQIKGFSEYGFPESHAASFALLVYASAWLKCHYPAEFTASLLNSQPMGFYAPAQLVRDAKEHGVIVRPVDVNHSGWNCTIEDDGALRLGMRLVNGVGKPDAEKIRAAVAAHGAFTSMVTLWRTSGARARTVRRLGAADAFGSMGMSRQQALWEARLLRDESLPLFDTPAATPSSGAHTDDDDGHDHLPGVTPLRQVVLDYDATGLSLKSHPVSFARERLRRLGAVACADLLDASRTPDGEVVSVAGLVLVRQRPGTANDVTFITLEDETGIANLIVWRRVYQQYRRAASSRLLVATGRVQRQGGVVHLTVSRMRGAEDAVEGLVVGSRDFH